MPTIAEALANAVQHHQAGELQAAEQIYRQILATDPNQADALHLLGVISLQLGKSDVAVEMLRRAIELNETNPVFHSNLGLAFHAQGKFDDAAARFRRALELKPDDAVAHYNCGNAHREQGKLDEAIACFSRALELNPGYAEAHNNLGNTLRAQGKLDQAVSCCRRAVELKPDYAEAHSNLGNALQDVGKPDEAIESYRRAMNLQSDNAVVRYNLGNALKAQGKLDDAIVSYNRALELNPDLTEAQTNLGQTFQIQGRLEEAVACCRRARELRPNDATAHYNLGSALHELGRPDEALACYRRALELEPDYVEAHNNHALLLLQQGDYERGWPEYEWRWKCVESGGRAYERPTWDGSPLAGRKSILLHTEQGFGDTLLFIRYAPLVRQHADEVILRCSKKLIPLLSRCRGIDKLIPNEAKLPTCDAEAYLSSLPLAFRTTLETVPRDVPYLFADPQLVEQWRSHLPAAEFRIGIVWQGNPGYKHDQTRSIPLAEFGRLAEVAGVRLISLQKEHGIDQLAEVKDRFSVTELELDRDDSTGAFMDTAAVIMNLDLVITPDTAIAHLAGGLGAPVWLALSFVHDWRWLRDRTDSPWYPTVRIFRQTSRGNWPSVFEQMKLALCQRLSGAAQERSDATMPTLFEALATAVQHHQAGELQAAEQIYRQILAVDPDQVDALHLLGVVASQVGNQEFAIESISRAIALDASNSGFHNNLGNAFKAADRLDEAIVSYSRALELQPAFAEAHDNLGNAFLAQGKLAEAVACFLSALQLAPTYAEAHNDLGNAFKAQQRPDAAIESYRRALELKPDYALAHNNLGTVLQDQGKLDDAVAAFRTALELSPNHPETLNNLGRALRDQRKLDDSVAAYRRALELKPDFVEAHINLGAALHDQRKLDEAVASFNRALHLSPNHATACFNLGAVLFDQGKLDEAIACYRRAVELKTDFAAAWGNLLATLQYRTGVNLKDLAAAHAEYERLQAAPFRASWRPHENDRDPDRRLRVGFVSPSFGWHPVGFFVLRALETLDRDQCETVCYSDRAWNDSWASRFQAAAGNWRDTCDLSDQELANQVRADKIDILFDLAGHTAWNRLLVFARKPAPIQVTWADYVGTTGLAAMDYILADRYEIPPEAEAHYSERVLRMPDGYICYDPPPYAPPVSSLPAVQQGCVTFGCFNDRAKITSHIVAVWARILHRVPRSRLVLKYRWINEASTVSRLASEFAAHGMEPGRIEFQGWSPHPELLTEYSRIDLALDTFPYNGGLTTCEALWMGVPVITCPGETFASRHSLSHLSNVGLTEFIARDLDEYVDLAVSLASDLPRLATLRASLRQGMAASPLCDGKQFADNLMKILRDAWRQWC